MNAAVEMVSDGLYLLTFSVGDKHRTVSVSRNHPAPVSLKEFRSLIHHYTRSGNG